MQFLVLQRKTTENSQDSSSLSRDLNAGPTKYELGATYLSETSVTKLRIGNKVRIKDHKVNNRGHKEQIKDHKVHTKAIK